jgi:hypothetical protein
MNYQWEFKQTLQYYTHTRARAHARTHAHTRGLAPIIAVYNLTNRVQKIGVLLKLKPALLS